MGQSKIILVTGGSRSGKSTFAENLYKDFDDVIYIATAKITDEEMEHRIARHRKSRNKNWVTYEGFKDLDKALDGISHKKILLDCVTIMVTNLMFEDENIDFDNITQEYMDDILEKVKKEFKKLIDKAREKNCDLVLVTNEVGMGIVPESKLGRIFRDIAGWVNQYIASLSDEVYLVCCGIDLKIK